jgi:hypothetical protein
LATAVAFIVAASAALTGCSGSKKSVSTGPLGTTEPSTTAVATTSTTSATTVGGGSGSTAVTVTVPPTTKSTTTSTTLRPKSASPVQVQVQVTSADDRRTVPVRVGDSVRLLLADRDTNWTQVSDSPMGLLAPAPAPAPPPHGQLVIWTAMHPGTVTVKAVGTPICAASVACPMYARLFEVTITIS